MSRLALALFILLLLASALGYLDRQAAAAVSPMLKEKFDLSDEDWGWVNSAFALVYFFSTVLGGLWIDRIGVRKGLWICVAFWSLAAAGHALASGFWSLCLWRMLLAVGEGPAYSSMLKGARRLMPPRLRDTGAGLVSASTMAGALVAPLIVVPLAVRFSWQAAFLVTAAFGLLWLPAWLALAYRPGANLGPEEIALQVADDQAPSRRFNWRSRALWATLTLIFFMMPPTIFVNNFLALYLQRTYQLTLEQSGWVQWQPFLAGDFGQVAGGAAAYGLLRCRWRFLSARRLVACAGLLGATVILAMNTADDSTTAMGWLNASRFCFMAAHTVLLAYGMESVAENQTGFMTGIMNATFSASNFLFNPIIGRLADQVGYHPVILILGLSPLVGLACWLVLSQLHSRRQYLS